MDDEEECSHGNEEGCLSVTFLRIGSSPEHSNNEDGCRDDVCSQVFLVDGAIDQDRRR